MSLFAEAVSENRQTHLNISIVPNPSPMKFIMPVPEKNADLLGALPPTAPHLPVFWRCHCPFSSSRYSYSIGCITPEAMFITPVEPYGT